MSHFSHLTMLILAGLIFHGMPSVTETTLRFTGGYAPLPVIVIAFGLAGVVPVLLLIVVLVAGQGTSGLIASALAAIAFLAGILVERWLFFATARHAVMNYYGG